ncbi:hypothetical protein LTR04_001681, partial [Oleoguttula sp. CCFEE 6159]
IRQDPIAKELVEKKTMEIWMAEDKYVISYPISAGEDFNMVLSHHRNPPVSTVQDVNMEDFRNEYKDFDPRLKRIIDMVPSAQRWPLLATRPESWSSPQKNIVLMGDAAHSMVISGTLENSNVAFTDQFTSMAQGAATSMEDGAFLGRCLREVVQNRISVSDAVTIYEKGRMPKASLKQQISFLNGAIWHLLDGPAQEARDRAMMKELDGEQLLRSPNLYADPATVLDVYGYNAEAHADDELVKFIEGRERSDQRTFVTKKEAEKVMDWFLPESEKLSVRAKL